VNREVVLIADVRARRERSAIPPQVHRPDADLDEAVGIALRGVAPLVGAALRAEAHDGVIVLTGTVEVHADRLFVIDEVMTVPGVTSVHCGIVLRSHPAGGLRGGPPASLRGIR
jgi:osmotically-inducible protein OsmY